MDKNTEIEKQICTLKEIRKMLCVNRTQFSKYMDIPLRTLEEWEAGRRKMPTYVLRLITYYVKTQKVLFDRDVKTIGKHINNALREELECDYSTVAKFAAVQIEGEHEVHRQIEYYNLDVIISIGFIFYMI